LFLKGIPFGRKPRAKQVLICIASVGRAPEVFLPGADGAFGSGIDEEYVQDLLKFPELVYGENLYFVPVVALSAKSFFSCFAFAGPGTLLIQSGPNCLILCIQMFTSLDVSGEMVNAVWILQNQRSH
jgi:hypothetical protein